MLRAAPSAPPAQSAAMRWGHPPACGGERAPSRSAQLTGTRQQRSAIGRQRTSSRAGWRACGPPDVRVAFVSSTRPTWVDVSTAFASSRHPAAAVRADAYHARCRHPCPDRQPPLVTGKPGQWVIHRWRQRCMSAFTGAGFRRSTTHWVRSRSAHRIPCGARTRRWRCCWRRGTSGLR